MLVLGLVIGAGCGGSDDSGATGAVGGGEPGCAAGERPASDRSCLPAGIQDDGCAAGEVALMGGGCQPAGVPPGDCAAGFVADMLGGCTAVMPAQPCTKGSIATPGDELCRPVAPCAAGTWGDIPVDAATEHVDASYMVGDSDGTSAKPWPTIGAAIAAASPGAIVAVGAGSYVEDLVVDKPLRVWGRCPQMVELVGTTVGLAAMFLSTGADASEIRDLSITGPALGILLSGAQDVLFDRLWVHDTPARGVGVEATLGPTSFTMARSLVEWTREFGVYLSATQATLDAVAVRDTQLGVAEGDGVGVMIRDDTVTGDPSSAVVRGSVLERNAYTSSFVVNSHAIFEGVLVRDTQPAQDGRFGRGIAVAFNPAFGIPASAEVRASVLENNREVGLFVVGATTLIETTVVRDTARTFQGLARGIGVQNQPSSRADVQMVQSLVERSGEMGIFVAGAALHLEGTVVRDTQSAATSTSGRGIGIQPDPTTGELGDLVVRSSVVERCHTIGIFVGAARAVVEGTLVRDVESATDGRFGRGICAQDDVALAARADLVLRASAVHGCRDSGVVVIGSDGAIAGTLVTTVSGRSADGLFGDGVDAFSLDGPASVTLDASRIEANARAGLAVFGADVTLSNSAFECNPIQLDVETFENLAPSLSDEGGNACACASPPEECRASSSNLAPPEPLR